MTTVLVRGQGWEVNVQVPTRHGVVKSVARKLQLRGLTARVEDGVVVVDAAPGRGELF